MDAPRLRRKLVERTAKQFGGKPVGQFDVGGDDFDVFGSGGELFLFALVLVQQRDGIDQGQVFFMIAPGAGTLRRKRQPVRKGVNDIDRFD